MGAVLLGGCDLVDEARAQPAGAEPTVVAEVAAASEPASAVDEPEVPQPMLLTRGGVSEIVQETVAGSEPIARPVTIAEPPPINDLGRPAPEPESSAFVPYDGGTGTVATAPASLVRPKVEPRTRPRPRPLAVEPDEPCDPGLVAATPPDREWECLACGRG